MGEVGKESANGSNVPRESNLCEFDAKMKKTQLHSLHGDWRKFKQFFAAQPEALLEPFDWDGNTALHVATRSDDPKFLRELLGMLKEEEQRWRALRTENAHRNTVLHHAIHCSRVEMLDVLLAFRDLSPRRRPEEIGKNMGEKERELLLVRNCLGETPVYRAARCGRIHMLVHLRKYYLSGQDLHAHFPKQAVTYIKSNNSEDEEDSGNSETQGKSILYLAIAGQYMDVAMWLISEVHGIEEVAQEADKDGLLTCLQLLSQMPSLFESHHQLRPVEKFIYYLLPMSRYPERNYESYDSYDDDDDDDDIYHKNDSIKGGSQKGDTESGNLDCGKKPASVLSWINFAIWKFKVDVLSRTNWALWKFIADEWDEIDCIWEKKRQQILAEKLAKQLVKKTNLSWKSVNAPTPINACAPVVVTPLINPPNVHKRIIKATLSKTQSMGEFTGSCFKSPLLLAASTGIEEIVKCIIERHPEAIALVEEEQNILHVAVKHRQRNIYRLIKRYGALKWLAAEISNKGRTVLHQVARMDYYNGGNRAGVVFQLQDELRWFERVKKAIPPALILHCNEDKLKANELFDIEHEVMLKEAQEWIKGTAQSCSAVAVLVATVVFAAAYTVPGGINDNGVPIFINSPLFLFFTIADVAALASSLVSVMMFLSILTAPFEMKNFLKCLPRKLTWGFTLLFCSLTITMLAFSSTILLNIRLEKEKWSTSLIYGVTFFPVALFGLMQFPIYMAVEDLWKRVLKACKKVLPSRFTKVAKNKKNSKFFLPKKKYAKFLY